MDPIAIAGPSVWWEGGVHVLESWQLHLESQDLKT